MNNETDTMACYLINGLQGSQRPPLWVLHWHKTRVAAGLRRGRGHGLADLRSESRRTPVRSSSLADAEALKATGAVTLKRRSINCRKFSPAGTARQYADKALAPTQP